MLTDHKNVCLVINGAQSVRSKKGTIEHCNKNLIMSEEEEQFQSSKTCWICEKLIDDNDEKVRDNCHVTGKFRDAAHWSCNKS